MLVTTAERDREIRRFQYGDATLWVIQNNLGGSRARSLLGKIDLYFGESENHLLLDLREAAFLDCNVADALEQAARRYPKLAIVGLPREYSNLPLRTRRSLRILNTASSIEEAFASLNGAALDDRLWEHKRRYTRIPVNLPVEIMLGTMSTAALLHDLSLGGGRIGRLPLRWKPEVEDLAASPDIRIAGLDRDPLGREIAGHYRTAMLTSRPVYLLPGFSGLGVRFSDSPAVRPA